MREKRAAGEGPAQRVFVCPEGVLAILMCMATESEKVRARAYMSKWVWHSPDISRVECAHRQGIRAADVVLYFKAMITQKMGGVGLPEGDEERAIDGKSHVVFMNYQNFPQ